MACAIRMGRTIRDDKEMTYWILRLLWGVWKETGEWWLCRFAVTILKEGTWNGASDIARSYSGSGRGREDGCHQKHCATAIKVGGGYNRFPSIFRALPNSIFEKCNEVRRRKGFARQNKFFFLRCANGDSDELNWATRMSIFPQRHVPSKGWVPKKCGSSRSYFVGSKLCPYNRYKYGCYWAPISGIIWPPENGSFKPKRKGFYRLRFPPFAGAKKIWVPVEFFGPTRCAPETITAFEREWTSKQVDCWFYSPHSHLYLNM